MFLHITLARSGSWKLTLLTIFCVLRFVLMTEIVFKAPHCDKLLKMKVSLLHVPNWYSLCENARYSNYREMYKIYVKFCFVFYFCGKIWSSPWSWRRGLIWIKSFKSLSNLFGDLDLKSLICLFYNVTPAIGFTCSGHK